LEPNGGESFVIGSSVTVRWQNPYPGFVAELAFSPDGGTSWWYVVDHLTGESYVWHPPAATLHGLLRVGYSNTSVTFDTTDAEFTVHGGVENARFALHRKDPERYPTVLCDDPSTSTVEPNYSPNYENIPCSQYTVNAPLGGSTVYIVVGQADPTEGVIGASFGIDYDGRHGTGIGIEPEYVNFTSCGGAIRYESDGGFGMFPAPKGGLVTYWGLEPDACQRQVIDPNGVHAVIGSLYVYAYSPDLLRITPNNNECCGPELQVMTCVGFGEPLAPSAAFTDFFDLLPPEQITPLMGRIQFGQGTGGYTPCASSGCSVTAEAIDVNPNTINTNSNGQFVSASVELPAVYDPADVIVATVKLNGQIQAADFFATGDFNQNGVTDFTVKFPRANVESVLPEGNEVAVTITGLVGECTFTGTTSVRIIRPKLHHPNGGESYIAGTRSIMDWDNPKGWAVDHAQIQYSADGGATWSMLADNVTGQNYVWAVPQEPTQNGRARVVLFDDQGVMGYDSSDSPFTIGAATGVESGIPTRHQLYQNAPNPFRGATRASFDLPQSERVTLKVFDLGGRMVRVLADEIYPAGRHEVSWNATDNGGNPAAAGIYFLNITAGSFSATKRMYLQR